MILKTPLESNLWGFYMYAIIKVDNYLQAIKS